MDCNFIIFNADDTQRYVLFSHSSVIDMEEARRMVQNCVNIFEISNYIILIKGQSKTEDNKKVNNDSVSVL